MRFGLDRMHRLMNVLELPRVPYPTIHVVGTNGKSSTTRMIAALLERHGLRTGCFTSPHLLSYRERIRIGERDIAPERFAAAVARTIARGRAGRPHGRRAGRRRHPVRAAHGRRAVEFAAAGVDVAVIEAGLGGRYDATNVVDSRVAVLTNVGLEHTRYLGPTVRRHRGREARRRAAAARRSSLGAGDRPGGARASRDDGRRSAARRSSSRRRRVDVELRAGGGYQRRNFAAAVRRGRARSSAASSTPSAVAAAAAAVVVPGRFEVLDGAPVTLLRRRPQRRRHRGARRVAAGVRRRAAGSSRSSRSSTTRTPRGCCAQLLAPRGRARLHGVHEPARAAGGDARLAGRPARRRRRDRRRGSARARSRARASWPGPDGVVLATGLDLPDRRPAAPAPGAAGGRSL